ncbi:MAG: hypothetical protein ABSE05_11830 [Syntrophales bacterium]|jgi:hypothetical protein
MQRYTLRLIIVAMLLVAAYVSYCSAYVFDESILNIATFVVLTLTLIALIIYAYDTNWIASMARARWEREHILESYYSMTIVPRKDNDRGRTLFLLGNPSTLMLRAKVWCSLQLYGQSVEISDDYNGQNTWYIFPQQVSQGCFEIADILAKKGKTIEAMIDQMTDADYGEQLTMDLKIEFRNELDIRRRLPLRRNYFDFKDWQWIPHLSKKDDWKV